MALIVDFDEAKRKGEIEKIEQDVLKGALPAVTFAAGQSHMPDGYYTHVEFGPVSLKLAVMMGGKLLVGENLYKDMTVLKISGKQLETELLKSFTNRDAAQILFDHVLDCFEQDLRTTDGKNWKEDVIFYVEGQTAQLQTRPQRHPNFEFRL